MTNHSICNRNVLATGLAVVTVSALFALNQGTAWAQSNSMESESASGARALDGYCPVCIIEMKKWVRGNPNHKAEYDGKTYYFPGEKQKEVFLADPAKYVPALGGDCTVCYVKLGKRVPGNVHHAAFHGKRLFLFPGDAQQQEFLANAEKYANVDLALGGKCAVCLAELKKEVPGKPEIAAVHDGLRYLFPSDKQRQEFLANPAKYAVNSAEQKHASTTAREPKLVTIMGKSGCAGCDYGVTPIGAPDELGLAVSTADGKVYVVEDAQKLYRDVYENRFEGVSLKVSGNVLKQDGKITWIQPKQLQVLN
jgi:YHS domain-containing protein